jgi:hypothetical protein
MFLCFAESGDTPNGQQPSQSDGHSHFRYPFCPYLSYNSISASDEALRFATEIVYDAFAFRREEGQLHAGSRWEDALCWMIRYGRYQKFIVKEGELPPCGN